MGIIPVLLQAWQSWNGGKTWTGSVIVLLTYGIQHYLPSLGMDKDAATIAATTIVQAIGYVVLITGAVHKIIKAYMDKKSGSTASTVAKMLIVGAVLYGALSVPQVQAKEVINQPFMYLDSLAPPAYMKPTDAYWFLKASATQTLIGIAKGSDGVWQATYITGTGIGIAFERDISILGKWYNSCSIAAHLVFVPSGISTAAVSGDVLIGTQIPLLGNIGVGPRFNGKNIDVAIGLSGSWNGKLF